MESHIPPKNNPKANHSEASGPSCVICFEHISSDTKAVIKTCSHEFCLVCIKSWIATTPTCPLCKQQFDILQHSFTSDGSYQEEKIEPPNKSDGGGGNVSAVEDELQCLDHSYFIGEVQRLLQDAERVHRQLWQENQRSPRGVAAWEQERLEAVAQVVAELRNHKRKLQALLQFDPHSTIQDLYRLQDLLRSSQGAPVIPTYTRSAPVRYSADDADLVDSDDDEVSEDFAYMNLGKKKAKAAKVVRQSKSKVRTPPSKMGTAGNYKGMAK